MSKHACRACRGSGGYLVLDLSKPRALCQLFPRRDDPGPDPMYPLQMWLCSSCGLAQLLADPTVPEEPEGHQSPLRSSRRLLMPWNGSLRRDSCRTTGVVAEYGSPHGGSWWLLTARPARAFWIRRAGGRDR